MKTSKLGVVSILKIDLFGPSQNWFVYKISCNSVLAEIMLTHQLRSLMVDQLKTLDNFVQFNEDGRHAESWRLHGYPKCPLILS